MTKEKYYASTLRKQEQILTAVPEKRLQDEGDQHRPPTHSRRGKTLKLSTKENIRDYAITVAVALINWAIVVIVLIVTIKAIKLAM